MNQTVEVSRRLFNLLAHVIVAVQVKDVRDQIKGILVVLDVGVEACQVEAVREVVFVNFAKVFIAAGRYKLS